MIGRLCTYHFEEVASLCRLNSGFYIHPQETYRTLPPSLLPTLRRSLADKHTEPEHDSSVVFFLMLAFELVSTSRHCLWMRRIRMFLCLPDPRLSLFCTDPDPSINKQKK